MPPSHEPHSRSQRSSHRSGWTAHGAYRGTPRKPTCGQSHPDWAVGTPADYANFHPEAPAGEWPRSSGFHAYGCPVPTAPCSPANDPSPPGRRWTSPTQPCISICCSLWNRPLGTIRTSTASTPTHPTLLLIRGTETAIRTAFGRSLGNTLMPRWYGAGPGNALHPALRNLATGPRSLHDLSDLLHFLLRCPPVLYHHVANIRHRG